MTTNDETKQLLGLLLRTRSNQRRIYVGLAITVACTTAVLLDFFSLWLVQSRVLAVALWLLLSLFVAATVGWAVVIDAQGLLFCRTWMGLPLARKRFPLQTPTTVDEDVYAPDDADFGRFVRLGTGEACEFGTRYNAKPLKAALDGAVARHHRS